VCEYPRFYISNKEPAKRTRAHLKQDSRSAPFSNDLSKLATALTQDSRVKHFQNLNWKRPFLSKSRYMSGRQCPKKLWQTVYDPEPVEEPLPGTVMFGIVDENAARPQQPRLNADFDGADRPARRLHLQLRSAAMGTAHRLH
jgi:hypothetical protein